jgi:hypothetical protein
MRLDAYLAREGVSATAAAKILRISRAGLYLLFHGRYPSVPVLYRIRRFTNGEVDIEDFLTPEDVTLGDDHELLKERIKKLEEAREKKRMKSLLTNQTKTSRSNQAKNSGDCQSNSSLNQGNSLSGGAGQRKSSLDAGCSVWGPGVGS